jgi:signal transduction histidine kinase
MNHCQLSELSRDRAETIGRMTPDLLHDMNNLLNLVLGSLDAIEVDAPTVQPLAAVLRESIDRVTVMYRQLLAYARRDEDVQPQLVDLGAAVNDLRAVLDLLAGRNIRISYDLRASGNYVSISPGAVDQLLINLVANARDAMPRGGRIDVIVRDRFEYGGGTTVLEVSDQGQGIAPDVVRRIFDPFYTTKASGTGLGLHVVRCVVDGAGGRVDVASVPGQGTRFTLTFPAAIRAARMA